MPSAVSICSNCRISCSMLSKALPEMRDSTRAATSSRYHAFMKMPILPRGGSARQ